MMKVMKMVSLFVAMASCSGTGKPAEANDKKDSTGNNKNPYSKEFREDML